MAIMPLKTTIERLQAVGFGAADAPEVLEAIRARYDSNIGGKDVSQMTSAELKAAAQADRNAMRGGELSRFNADRQYR